MAVESRGDMEDEEEWHPLYGSKEYTEDELQQYRKQAHNLTIWQKIASLEWRAHFIFYDTDISKGFCEVLFSTVLVCSWVIKMGQRFPFKPNFIHYLLGMPQPSSSSSQ